MQDLDHIRTLVDTRDRTIQKARIAFSNRLSAIERGADPAGEYQQEIVQKYLDRLAELESELDSDIARAMKDIEIYQHMRKVKGVGPMYSAKIISMVDITRCNSISALWRYAGYGVVTTTDDEGNTTGARERPVSGEKLHYNMRLKTTMYLVAGSFLKCNSPYRRFYDSAKERYATTHPDWTKLHVHNAALRKMVKMFLSHLWVTWRQLEGLPVTMPYVHEHLGHNTYYTPQEFGWPEIEKSAA